MIDPDLDAMRYVIRKEREMSYFYNDWTTATQGPTGTTGAISWTTGTPINENITYKGNTYNVNSVEMVSSGRIIIEGTRYLYNYSDISVKDVCKKKNGKENDSLKGKFAIKKVVVNPSKNATTVIFEDGTVEVVKKSPDDPEADIFSVVAYAVAKHVYGSNSAFKREVLKNLDFIDREFEKFVDRTSCEDLAKAMRKVVEHIKKKNRKENDNDA